MDFLSGLMLGASLILFFLTVTIKNLTQQLQESNSKLLESQERYQALLIKTVEIEKDRNNVLRAFVDLKEDHEKLCKEKLMGWGIHFFN